mmetsp:Transcript_9161/g.6912  ORF Transcript_9161/g.6912 Transcript_9161/m.6912 type:complete len:153 (-) Transcript_9161:58-516(-)
MIAALGFTKTTGFFRNYLKLHDSQGVQYMHGWAGIIGGFTSAITIGFADENFGDRYNDMFYSPHDQAVRSTARQAGMQLATLGLSLGIAIFGGAFTGLIASRPWFGTVKELFSDTEHWRDVEPPTDDDLYFARETQHEAMEEKENLKGKNHI